jgi:hypothetical protein
LDRKRTVEDGREGYEGEKLNDGHAGHWNFNEMFLRDAKKETVLPAAIDWIRGLGMCWEILRLYHNEAG